MIETWLESFKYFILNKHSGSLIFEFTCSEVNVIATAVADQESQRAGMVSALDEAVANVTAALRRSNLYQDTIILFLSDNGGAERGSNWPLRGKKNSVYEGGTRTVAFVHSPRLTARMGGTVSRGLVHLVDWYPTILALAASGGDICEDDVGDDDNGVPQVAVKTMAAVMTAGTSGRGEESAPLLPLDGVNQAAHLMCGTSAPRKELIYNINDALRVTAAIRKREISQRLYSSSIISYYNLPSVFLSVCLSLFLISLQMSVLNAQ